MAQGYLFIYFTVLLGIVSADLASEREAQKLEIKLYQLSESKWSGTNEGGFQDAIAAAANTYCTSSPSSCNLQSAATFTSSLVTSLSKKDNSKSMLLQFSVDLPAGSSLVANSPLDFVLSKTVLKVLAENSRDTIKDDIDVWITYIGTNYLGIPPADTANAVIIPIAVIIVLVVAVVTICLVKWQSKKEREDRLHKRQLKKTYGANSATSNADTNTTMTTMISSGNPTPRHGISNKVVPDDYSHPPTYSLPPVNPLKTPQANVVQGKSYARPPKMTEFRSDDEEIVHTNGKTVLIPMKGLKTTDSNENLTETEAERQERRKRKKEKRREKKRLQQQMEGYDNQALDTSGALTDTDNTTSYNNVPTFAVHSGAVVS